MPSSVCQLDNIETSGRFRLPQSYQQFATSFNREEWLAVRETYQILDIAERVSRLERLDDCRQVAWFVRDSESGKVRVSANHCRLRWCPLCSNAKKHYVAGNLQAWLETASYPKMVTLTLKHSNAELSHQIDCLYRFFRLLRRSCQLKPLVTGGIWFFQIKFNTKSGQWHPHIHALMTGKYIPHGMLSQLWLKITKSSKIVDIRPVKDFKKASYEVGRYCARPSPVHTVPYEHRTELFLAMHGRRLCGSWGAGRAVLLSQPRDPNPGRWVRLCRWSTLQANLEANLDAQAIYKAWSTNEPLPEDVTLIDVDDFIDGGSYELEPEPPPQYLWKE